MATRLVGRGGGWLAAVVVGQAVGVAAAGEPSDAIQRQRAIENPDRDSFILDEPATIELSGHIQFRYQTNLRDDAGLAMPDNDTTTGFLLRRTKLAAKIMVTETISGKIQLAFNRGTGDAALEEGEIVWKVAEDWTVRMGQFKIPLLREALVSSKRQLSTERSAIHAEFTQDYSQLVEVDYKAERFRAAVAISDGINSDNTLFNGAMEADFALTGRAEYRLGEAGFKQFDQFTSFRGATRGAMIGVAGHWQTMGDTNPSLPASMDMTTVTADLSLVGSGWNGYVAGVWRSMDIGAVTADDLGVVAQGGVFVADDDELFARYQGFFPDDFAGATDLHGVTVGWNHYFSPESHAAKFTLDVTYWFDPITSSTIATSDGHNLMADANDGQLALTAQVQLLF